MTTPNNGELGLLASTFPCRNSFDFLRYLLGTAAFVCSVFSVAYHMEITEAKENEDAKVYQILAALVIDFCILLLPLAMLGRHLIICYLLPKKSAKKAWYWRIGLRIASLFITSFTMLESVTASAIEVRKEEKLKMMSSIILCEGALLAEDNYGVFELALTVFVVQFIKTFPKLGQPYWYSIILVVYIGRAVVMHSMKKMKEKVTRKREVGAKKGENNSLENLDREWELTNNRLRGHHRINVDEDLPSFRRMKIIINDMNEDTTI